MKITAPLGIRFWDYARNVQVSSDLIVSARLVNSKNPISFASTSSSGIYVFHHLPGLRKFEFSSQEWNVNNPVTDTKQYVIQVKDIKRRFIPVSFKVEAPFKGIFPGEFLVSPTGVLGFDLFSTPVREISAQYVEVYARLWNIDDNVPASFALMKVTVNSSIEAKGISDEDGKIKVLFLYPPIYRTLTGSPSTGLNLPLEEQVWNAEIEVFYQPAIIQKLEEVNQPNFRSILLQQNCDIIFENSSNTTTPSMSTNIYYGKSPTVLKTIDSDDVKLYIRPAYTSP